MSNLCFPKDLENMSALDLLWIFYFFFGKHSNFNIGILFPIKLSSSISFLLLFCYKISLDVFKFPNCRVRFVKPNILNIIYFLWCVSEYAFLFSVSFHGTLHNSFLNSVPLLSTCGCCLKRSILLSPLISNIWVLLFYLIAWHFWGN